MTLTRGNWKINEIIKNKIITNFDTTAELATFSATTNFGRPHVSLTKDDMIVHYHPLVVAKLYDYLYDNG